MNNNDTSQATQAPQFDPLKCLNPNHDREAMARGLCRNCYSTAAALIRKGRTTWEELERAGKALPNKNTTKSQCSPTEWLLPSTK